jgi:hypothetical protein
MLAHSPPFPLIVNYDVRIHDLFAEDEEGMMLALEHHDRVQGICICLQVPSLQRLISTMANQFPALEYLCIYPPTVHSTQLTLPSTLETPALRQLELTFFASPIGSPFLLTAIGLVSLSLVWIHPSTYPHPNNFLQQLSLLPQLGRIIINFRAPAPKRDIERQPLNIPVAIHVTLHNLYLFDFAGASGFLESVLPHVSTPLLKVFRARFSNQLHFSVPHLQHFIMTTEIPKFSHIKFIFHHEAVVLFANSTVVEKSSDPEVTVSCRHLDWQVSSATQISKFLRQLFSEVVDLTLDYRKHTLSSEWHNQVDRTQWRELFGSFSNVKTLRVHNGLVGEVSRSLILDGEPPLEVLPDLRELICPSGSVDDQTFEPFIHEREVAGQPVKLIGEAVPVGPFHYYFYSPAGKVEIGPDSLYSSGEVSGVENGGAT